MSRSWFEGWPGQYRRMLRWQTRVADVLAQGDDLDAEMLYDFLYSFFQASHGLRDWLAATDACTQSELQALFDDSAELQLCRDICNASKHLRVTRHSIDPAPRIAREYDPWTKGTAGWFLYSDKRRPILELVSDCAATWKRFLAEKNLLDASGSPVPFEPLPGPPPS